MEESPQLLARRTGLIDDRSLQVADQLGVKVPVGLGDQRILGRKVMIDQTDRDVGLGTDAPDRQAIVAEFLQAFDRGFDQRQPPLIRQLALVVWFCVFFFGVFFFGCVFVSVVL